MSKYEYNGLGKNWSKGKQLVDRHKCTVCGNEFYIPPCYLKRSKNSGLYCSVKCKGKDQSKIYAIKYKELRDEKQKTKENYKNITLEKEKNICPICGMKTKLKYCNKKCYSIARTTKVKNKCLNCSAEYTQLNWESKQNKHLFCSISCSKQYNLKNMKSNCYSNSKGGKREDLNDMYFRSRWEANYARYLNLLVNLKQIIKWEYEPDTFIFDDIKRGTKSYLPDFKVYLNDNKYEYHEVKGYNSPISQTKLKRMAKFYPNEKVILIDKPVYMEIHKKMKSIIKK